MHAVKRLSWASSSLPSPTFRTQNTYCRQSTLTREKANFLPITQTGRLKPLPAMGVLIGQNSNKITGFPLQTHILKAELLEFQFQSHFSILLLSINGILNVITFMFTSCHWNCVKHTCASLLTQNPGSQHTHEDLFILKNIV